MASARFTRLGTVTVVAHGYPRRAMTQHHATPQPAYQVPARLKNWVGTTALAAAVLGLVFCWSVVGGVLLGAVAIVMGISGRTRAQRREADNRTVASSGIALGALAIVVSLALVPVWMRFFREVRMPTYFECVADTRDQDGARRCADDFQKRIDELFDSGGPSARSGSA